MLQTAPGSGPYTWDDFVALEEDDLRELIDGELVEVEVPTVKHEEIVVRRSDAGRILREQLASLSKERREVFEVVYASPHTDVAANMELARETVVDYYCAFAWPAIQGLIATPAP